MPPTIAKKPSSTYSDIQTKLANTEYTFSSSPRALYNNRKMMAGR